MSWTFTMTVIGAGWLVGLLARLIDWMEGS